MFFKGGPNAVGVEEYKLLAIILDKLMGIVETKKNIKWNSN
jgi:hypothetical protein